MIHKDWEALLSVLHKAIYGEQISRVEVHNALNYLFDNSPQGIKFGGLEFLIQLIRDPSFLLSVSAFAMAISTKITPEVLCGMYDSMKDQGLYREENGLYKISHAVSGIGTGGKQLKTINVSTASAIIAASAGGIIVRSSTRGFFGSTGASDFLKTMNIPRITNLAHVQPILSRIRLAFIEGEAFSPFSKYVKPFTHASPHTLDMIKLLLQPIRLPVALMKPVGCDYAYRGVILPVTHAIAEALRLYRGFKKGLIVFGRDIYGRGFDEFSNIGPTEVSVFDTGGTQTYTLWPGDVGLPLRRAEDVEVKCKEDGYTIAMEVFKGKRVKGDPFAELLALNAGGMLYAGNFANSISEGVDKSMTAIEKGASYQLIEQYRQACNLIQKECKGREYEQRS